MIGAESGRLERLVGDLLESGRMRKSAFTRASRAGRSRGGRGGRGAPLRGHGARRRPDAAARHRGRRRRVRRPRPRAPGRLQPRRERDPLHAGAGHGDDHHGARRDHRRRHGARPDQRRPAARLRALLPLQPLRHRQARRHRSGVGDRQGAHGGDGRHGERVQRRRRGHRVHGRAAAGPGRAGGARPHDCDSATMAGPPAPPAPTTATTTRRRRPPAKPPPLRPRPLRQTRRTMSREVGRRRDLQVTRRAAAPVGARGRDRGDPGPRGHRHRSGGEAESRPGDLRPPGGRGLRGRLGAQGQPRVLVVGGQRLRQLRLAVSCGRRSAAHLGRRPGVALQRPRASLRSPGSTAVRRSGRSPHTPRRTRATSSGSRARFRPAGRRATSCTSATSWTASWSGST